MFNCLCEETCKFYHPPLQKSNLTTKLVLILKPIQPLMVLFVVNYATVVVVPDLMKNLLRS